MRADGLVADVFAVSHRYGSTVALQNVELVVPVGACVGLIGPDGVGKSTLLGLVAGARRLQAGRVRVLGGDMAQATHRAAICARIGYMPQGLGRNLYADLTVRENIDFFARLFGQSSGQRRMRIEGLIKGTALAPFADRPAGKLSGGMRQKLGLCCSLVHDPDLLILDEPTTGVDPLSRRQFWQLIDSLRARRPRMSVLVATAYEEEAERFDALVVMHGGRVLAAGSPAELKTRTAAANLSEAFIKLLPDVLRADHVAPTLPPRLATDHPVIIAKELTRRFGDFTAVDRVSFRIEQGEIFGFVGSNGCGKTTTMRMLTGLLPPSSGEAWILGQRMGEKDTRTHVGYMSQSFSLYVELTVDQNLFLHAHLYHLSAKDMVERVRELEHTFGLVPYSHVRASSLPLGIRQRLSLAVAIVHRPELLILDEPTSGVDPLARDSFWLLLIELARNHGVTIFISTHFMNEAARCDRVALMHAGQVLATGHPDDLIAQRGAASLEEAFILYLEDATRSATSESADIPMATPSEERTRLRGAVFSPGRMFAYTLRETLELRRDPVRLSFALLGILFLMLVLGFGVNTDVDHLAFAALDRDNTTESRAYLQELRGSIYFNERRPILDYADLETRLASGELKVAIEIPAGFGRDLRRGRQPEIGAWIDDAMPFHGETTRGYLLGVQQKFLTDLALREGYSGNLAPAVIETRFRYNQDFESVKALVPSTIAMLLALVPAILMALAVVREKELGSITNLYVTPVTRLEFLVGKQLPYVALAMVAFVLMVLMAIFVFGVPLKGDVSTLALGTLIYVTATTGYGMLISAFASTQIAALFGTAILTVLSATQFSGMMTPVSSLSGLGAVMGRFFPMTYFLPVTVGTFTKSLGLAELWGTIGALALFVPVLLTLTVLLTRAQER